MVPDIFSEPQLTHTQKEHSQSTEEPRGLSPEHKSFSCLANIIYTDVFQITTDECYIHY